MTWRPSFPLRGRPPGGWNHWNPVQFIAEMSRRHPELARPVSWPVALEIARREGITVQLKPISHEGRFFRYKHRRFVQLRDDLPRSRRTEVLMHELVHAWRDDPGESCYYYASDMSSEGDDPCERFANNVAWILTSTAPRPTGWDTDWLED